jgi:hypothetical protein
MFDGADTTASMLGLVTILLVVLHFRTPAVLTAEIMPWFYPEHAAAGFFIVFSVATFLLMSDGASLYFAIVTLFNYSALLFVVLCHYLRHQWAGCLTVKRGEKWVKEIDYLTSSSGPSVSS